MVIVTLSQCRAAIPVRKVLDQRFCRYLNREDRRCFEGLDKSTRQPDRDTVLDPRLPVISHTHLDDARFRIRNVRWQVADVAQMRKEFGARFIVAPECAGIHITSPNSAIERYAPNPTGSQPGRTRAGLDLGWIA